MKAQATAMLMFSERLDGLAVTNCMEDRLRFMEGRFDALFGPSGSEPKLSPFKQQAIIEQLSHLEDVVSEHTDAIKTIQSAHSKVLTALLYTWVSRCFPCTFYVYFFCENASVLVTQSLVI